MKCPDCGEDLDILFNGESVQIWICEMHEHVWINASMKVVRMV